MKQITGAFCTALITALALAGLPTASAHAEENGPIVLLMVVSPDPAYPGDLVTVTARAAVGDSPVATYPVYAQFNVNDGPWTAMTPTDGVWDYFFEDISASYTAATLGANVVCVEAYSADSYWSDPACIAIFVYPRQPADVEGPITSAVAASPDPVVTGDGVTVTASVDDAATGGSSILSAEFNVNGGVFTAMTASDGAFDDGAEGVTGTFTASTAGPNNVCVQGTDALGNVGAATCISVTVVSSYTFAEFSPPVGTTGTIVKARRLFPIAFRLTMTADGSPVRDPGAITGAMSYAVDCTTLAGDPSSAVAEGGLGRHDFHYRNRGSWIFLWQIPRSYGGTCRMLFVSLSDGSMSPSALFRIRR